MVVSKPSTIHVVKEAEFVKKILIHSSLNLLLVRGATKQVKGTPSAAQTSGGCPEGIPTCLSLLTYGLGHFQVDNCFDAMQLVLNCYVETP